MKKVLIVNANYYKQISSNLVLSCKKELIRRKIKASIINVPGCFEIPYTIKKYIKSFDGFVALGCLIKGETPHFDLICKTSFEAIMQISVDNKKPIGNGIITALNKSQAIQRSSIKINNLKKNKGEEAAKAVISIFNNEPKTTK